MQTYAPAEGFLGPFTWWKEHHKLVSKWGKALVMYKIRYGGHNSILHAECDDPVKSPDGKTPCVMPKEQMLASIKDVCAMPPLSLTPEQYAELGLSSHALHALNVGLGAFLHFEWVATDANIADYPSRGEFGLLEELGSTAMPLTFPPFDGWLSPEEARAAAADVPPAAQEPSQPGTSGAKSYDTGYSKRGRRSGGKPK